MRRYLKLLLKRFTDLNDAFAEHAGQVLSWSIWMSALVILVLLWITIHDLTHGKFDVNYVVLMLILTIQTSLDSQATKLFQLSLRKKDKEKEDKMAKAIERIEFLVTENEKRDIIMLGLVNAMDLAVDKLVERGEKVDAQRPTASPD